MKDRLMELLLAAWDRLMDWLSSGRWTQIRGEVRDVTIKEDQS